MNLQETELAIQHHGEQMRIAGNRAVKENRMDDARRCADLMEYAREHGRLLHGTPEMRDPGYSMGYQKLIGAAQLHGLIDYDNEDPKPD